MSSFNDFSRYISENAASLAGEVVEAVIRRTEIDIQEWEKEQALSMYSKLLGFFGESLIAEGKEVVPDALIGWSKRNAAMQVSSGGRISEIVVRYPPTREIFNDMFTAMSVEYGLTVKENALVIKRINTILDISLNETFFAFERLSDKLQKETQKELVKLSAPIVPVREDIVVLPLVGYMDNDKVNHIMDDVVPKISEMNVSHVITDFSGTMTIDFQMAEALYRIGGTLRLMGIHIVVAGLRPDLVQTIVNSGIDMSRTEAFMTVKQALESIKS